MIYDKYFFLCLSGWLLFFALCAGIIALGVKYKNLGKIVFWAFLIIGGTFDLVQCSDMTARNLRYEYTNVPEKEK